MNTPLVVYHVVLNNASAMVADDIDVRSQRNNFKCPDGCLYKSGCLMVSPKCYGVV